MIKTNLVLVTIITICVGLTIGWVLDFTAERRWEKTNHLLEWDDFRGIPDLWSIVVDGSTAAIRSDIKHQTLYEWEIIQGSCHFWFTKVEGTAYMSRIESWVKPGMNSFSALQHEQIHFDITEVYAEKFNKRVENELLNRVFLCPVGSDWWSESKIKTAANAQVTTILNQIKKQMYLMQKTYDEQTRHGINYEEQNRWQYMIMNRLDN